MIGRVALTWGRPLSRPWTNPRNGLFSGLFGGGFRLDALVGVVTQLVSMRGYVGFVRRSSRCCSLPRVQHDDPRTW